MSDILNWVPSGGTQTLVNNQTWGSIPYAYPPNLYYNASGAVIDPLHIDTESRWYILWMQSLPGFGQQIPYNGNYLTNWWKIIYDWDDYYNKGLYRAFPDALPNPCTPVCGSTFTDTGGSGSNYDNNSSVVKIFCPDNAGQNVKVTFTSFNTQAQFDKLYVYNGPDLHYPLISSGNNAGQGNCTLAGGYWGNLNGALPGPFVSTHESGCLTFRFCSDASITEAGWTSDISCINCTGMVSSTSDNVPGCLRWALECANTTDTIVIAPNLTGATLQVQNMPLPVNKNLSFIQTQSSQVNILGVNTPTLFDIQAGKTVFIKYLNLFSETGTQGRLIKNQGNLTLENVILNDKANAIPGSSGILNTGTLKIMGNVNLRKY
ncbi:MAG: hypothetical protein IPN29_14420 [Saprospiraceae bacterium]|nr:hypothetical protein [Saprospiraceae bacterium]